MNSKESKEPEKQPQPRRPGIFVAILITVVLLALAVQSQLKTGHVDTELISALVVLAAFWLGITADNFLPLK